MTTEKRYYEIREVDNRTIRGIAVEYGDTAFPREAPQGERFLPGAFGSVKTRDVILNIQHNRNRPIARTGGGGLEFQDSAEALELVAELPNTREADDALELVNKKILRGFSLEFVSRKERREAGVRVIESALLAGISLVDTGAYPGSIAHRSTAGFILGGCHPVRVEYRQRRRRALITGYLAYDTEVVVSARHKRSEIIKPGAFGDVDKMNVFLLSGLDYSEPVASVEAGNLRVKDGPKRLEFEADSLPRTAAVSTLVENGRKFEQSVRVGYIEKPDGIEKLASKVFEGFELSIVSDTDGLCELGINTRGNMASKVSYGGRRGGRRR